MQGDLKKLGWDRRGDRLGWEGLWLTFTPLVTLGQGHGKVAFSREIFFYSLAYIQLFGFANNSTFAFTASSMAKII